MLRRLQNSVAAMTQALRHQERLANNLANLNAPGFKRQRFFAEVLEEFINPEGAPESIRALRSWSDFTQGPLEATGNPLDLALEGDGLFAVETPAGEPRYTRTGHFILDAQGYLTLPTGERLLGEEGPLQIPPDRAHEPLHIAHDGEVRVGTQPVGKLRVVTFARPEQLERAEHNTFRAPEGEEPIPLETPGVRQGFIEASNVDPVQEMTDMITYLRMYESQQHMVQTQDQLLGRIARELGKW